MPRTIAIIQARMSSSRLPGKVLMPLLDRPMIVFMLERVRQARRLDEVIVATSDDPSDDALAATVTAAGFGCHRGSLTDVLDRYHGAALSRGADRVVRLTGDCPLMDADIVDRALELLETSGADYVSNVEPPTFPDGLDCEAFHFAGLQRACDEARLPMEREHVTPYLRERKDLFRTASWQGLSDLSALRWTVDHPDDLAHVRRLVEQVGARTPVDFDRFDLYRVIERLASASAQPTHRRNENLPAHPGSLAGA
jgi:spore coat polysaccharide biosynthesis protein SpsF (cytidylyltransferase family)